MHHNKLSNNFFLLQWCLTPRHARILVMKLSEIIKISRPRFWLYEAGTFLIGSIIAYFYLNTSNFDTFLFWFIYFLIPANILIYGINDIFDYETDLKNAKKQEYETLLKPSEHKSVWLWIFFTNIPFFVYALFFEEPRTILWLCIFAFFATFYSAVPIRAKARPFFDSFFSAGHYIATGVFGYVIFENSDINYLVVLAGILWAMAMHAYSAVPDIKADNDADLETVATKLGFTGTVYLCGIFYAIAFLIASYYLSPFFLIFSAPYLYLMWVTVKNKKDIFRYYKYFPILNALTGFFLSCILVIFN